MTTTATGAGQDALVDGAELEGRVTAMYCDVALRPHGEFHFEMGRGLAERLGYDPADLERIPAEALESFAGVGHHLDLAALRPGERVLDLGSGSGTDAFSRPCGSGRGAPSPAST